jgi:hypothetical protein
MPFILRKPGATGERLRSPSPSGRIQYRKQDPSIEFRPLRASVFDEQDRAWAQACSALLVLQHAQELLELPLALRRDHSAFKQDSAQLVDQSRPHTDQTVSRSMKRLHVAVGPAG